ncbi:MAG: response regulator [Planctomycetaceae bacterium]|nr:response regulator [Planctomycetota bacterium]NUN53591.1 response regulator [Planctomycetaceae bacterium]
MARRVLVCDDEPFILKALTFIVRKEGHTVLEARNGEEAVQRIRADRPDLVFLDLMMPKKNGYEVLQEVRADPELASTYVILLTAKGQDSDRERGLSLGANEFMTKPFSPAVILQRLRAILAGDAPPPA